MFFSCILISSLQSKIATNPRSPLKLAIPMPTKDIPLPRLERSEGQLRRDGPEVNERKSNAGRGMGSTPQSLDGCMPWGMGAARGTGYLSRPGTCCHLPGRAMPLAAWLSADTAYQVALPGPGHEDLDENFTDETRADAFLYTTISVIG